MAAVNIEFPGNLAQVETAADLRGVPSTLMPNGLLYLVSSARGLFEYDPGSLLADDGVDVLRPLDKTAGQVGRWIRNINGLAPGIEGPQGPAGESDVTELRAEVAEYSDQVDLLRSGVSSGIVGFKTWAALDLAYRPYDPLKAYVADDTMVDQSAVWVAVAAGTGQAPPVLPVTSNAYWRVGRTSAAGFTAQVPVSDTGSHTDPVVGGTVPNSGIFRFSLVPTGFEYLYPTEAALAAPFVAAASAEADRAEAAATQANLFNNAELITGNLFELLTIDSSYISPTGAVINTNNTYRRTDFIEVRQGQPLALDVSATAGTSVIAWYDTSKSFLYGVEPVQNNRLVAHYFAPEDGYAIVSVLKDGVLPVTPENTIRYGASAVVDAHTYAGNLALLSSVGNGYLNQSDALTAEPNWNTTPVFLCQPGDKFAARMYSDPAVAAITFRDASNAVVAKVSKPNAGLAPCAFTATAPAGTAGVQFSYGNSSLPPFINGMRNEIRNVAFSRPSILQPTDQIALFGDSRMSYLYPWIPSAWQDLTGATVFALGVPGTTVAQNASNYQIGNLFTVPGGDPRVIVYLPGGNDNGAAGTVGTFAAGTPNAVAGESIVTPLSIGTDVPPGGSSFIACVDLAVRKMIAHYGNVRARAGIVGGDSADVIKAKLLSVVRPIMVLVADLPQQRNNGSDPYSLPANWNRKRLAIIEVAARNGVRCVDVQSKLTIDMTQETFFVQAENDVTNVFGSLYYDGLHPYLLHYEMAEIVVAEVGLSG